MGGVIGREAAPARNSRRASVISKTKVRQIAITTKQGSPWEDRLFGAPADFNRSPCPQGKPWPSSLAGSRRHFAFHQIGKVTRHPCHHDYQRHEQQQKAE